MQAQTAGTKKILLIIMRTLMNFSFLLSSSSSLKQTMAVTLYKLCKMYFHGEFTYLYQVNSPYYFYTILQNPLYKNNKNSSI